jgi:hypothetical protein
VASGHGGLDPVATSGGPTMFARIGIMWGLNRGHVREFNPDRKEHHWGRRKAETRYVMNDNKDSFDLWCEWAEKPLNSMLMIDSAIHDAVMALPPDKRRDRAKVNEAVRRGKNESPTCSGV